MNNIKGLTATEAEESAKKYGKNIISNKKKKTFFDVYWDKYNDPIIKVLLLALGINVMFTFLGKVDWHECAGILLSVIISTFVSAISEYSNENTFLKLQSKASMTKCKVWRDNKICEIYVSDTVVGDCVLLQSGDIIPADGRITEGRISVDQSPLTGESKEAEKRADRIMPKTKFNDFWNEYNVFKGCVVCSGEANMIIDEIGDNTVYGKLSLEAQEETRESPLEVKLSKLAKTISRFGVISAVIIVVLSFLNNAFIVNAFDSVRIATYFSDTAQVLSDLVSSIIIGIIVIVVAVPEGLPLMIAIVCSLNMKKMLKANVLVRKIIGIETAGGINVLFTDKTGTITKGEPEVIKFLTGDMKEYTSFDMFGDAFKRLYGLSVVHNSMARYSGNKIIGGNGTEKALLRFAAKKGARGVGYDCIKSVPFSSDKKYSTAVIKGEGKSLTLVKGAPEIILPLCHNMYTQRGDKEKLLKADIDKKINEYAKSAMRLIAIAVSEEACDGDMPESMNLLGIAAIFDDVRPEARSAVEEVSGAGISVIMITGDRRETAVAIGERAGLLKKDGIVIDSKELSQMTDEKVKEILPKLCVVARAMPGDKSRLVKIAQSMNLVVGMTGDGVNDVPALKLSDVGFSMGGGTEAAAAASDIVILDDNFISVKNAVLYGRTIFESIKKFIKFQLTINVAAVAVSMLGPIVGVEKPLDISQMIWTNLMIDSLAAIAFGGEPALSKYMKSKPRSRDETIPDKNMWSGIITNGLYISFLSLVFFTFPAYRTLFRNGAGDIYFYTGYFTFFIFISIFNAFNARSDEINILKGLSKNKQFVTVMGLISLIQIIMTYFGGAILRTAGLTGGEWAVVLLTAATIFPVDIIRKIIIKRKDCPKNNNGN